MSDTRPKSQGERLRIAVIQMRTAQKMKARLGGDHRSDEWNDICDQETEAIITIDALLDEVD
jgi:hypothetical protein